MITFKTWKRFFAACIVGICFMQTMNYYVPMTLDVFDFGIRFACGFIFGWRLGRSRG